MEYKRLPVHIAGGCNYCDRGQLSLGGHNLVYPYEEVFEIQGDRIKTKMCQDCLNELIEKSPIN